MKKTCIWKKQKEHGVWKTQCGKVFVGLTDLRPSENGMIYCDHCGKMIQEEK